MSRRRQRRATLPPESTPQDPPREPSLQLRRRSSLLLSRSRTKSSPRLSLFLRRRDSAPSPPPPRQPSQDEPVHLQSPAQHYVPVRVLDFVTVPAARLGQPRDALGPFDAAIRPPSYNLTPVQPSARRHSHKPSWDGHAIDSILDREHPPSPKQQVFVFRDRQHTDQLLSIVQRTAQHKSDPFQQEEEHSSLTSSSQFSSSSSTSSSDTAPSTNFDSVRSVDCTVGSDPRSTSTLPLDPLSNRLMVKQTSPVRRPCLFPNKVPSPVKYTFRPPVPPALPQIEQPPSTRPTVVMPVLLPSHTPPRQSSALSTVSSGPASSEAPTLRTVKAAVDTIDPKVVLNVLGTPGVSFFRRVAKRDSDESCNSISTEYYEDEYTKFIERKPLSPRRLYLAKMIQSEAWRTSHGSRLECRSNSTVSSDDDFELT